MVFRVDGQRMLIVQELFFCKIVSEYWVLVFKHVLTHYKRESLLSKGFLGNNRKKNRSFEGRSVPIFG